MIEHRSGAAPAGGSPDDGIAIVGLACRYPDARSPEELWRNVLAQRRAFRRLPSERLRFEDYSAANRNDPDSIDVPVVAVIEGYVFDRARFRVAGPTYRAADLAHWLALDVASQALADAGFDEGEGLPRESTGVVVGNTLTGEFSRAATLRLRWPYVRRVVDASLREHGWPVPERREFMRRLEARYKAPFPEPNEETLAGGLSNTIAGRICNHFDLKGGGYTVDGACAASLLAVTTACSSLACGDLDVALAGGVDLSLDPFELVGFSRAGALAPELMRVYDQRSAGFWPGEGCGFVVLMRARDALARGARIYALVRGWGVASDGSGGITRPEAEGQLLALRRAYRRAGYGADTVVYFEGHGTGTSVGDAVELEVLSRARRESSPATPEAAVGSIKANIGHTKAAAGVAGLIKATLAVHHQIQPPTTGCFEPHRALEGAAVRILRDAEPWPADRPLRAAVSAMGFGGIDTHLTLESLARERRSGLDDDERSLASTPQDAELFLLGAGDARALGEQIERLARYAGRISLAEMADLAAALERALPECPRHRAAIVASTAAELEARLAVLAATLREGRNARLDPAGGLFLGEGERAPRIGFLFPGQGSPSHLDGGLWRRRFEFVRPLYDQASFARSGDPTSTAVAQPAIVTASIAGLAALGDLGLAAGVAAGHSLGELTALHWAGSLGGPALVRLAAARGRVMAGLGGPTGAMASLALPAAEAAALIAGSGTVIAGVNAPRQTVISGEARAVAEVVRRARAGGVGAVKLPVSHGFHSPLMEAAAPALAAHLASEPLGPLQRRVFSTISGGPLAPDVDLAALLLRQLTSPVLFCEAFLAADAEVELWIEVGPGQTLTGLVANQTRTPTFPIDAGGASIAGLLRAAGAAWALGAGLRHPALFQGRFIKPFDLDWQPRFFANPCEQAPLPEETGPTAEAVDGAGPPDPAREARAAHEPAPESAVEGGGPAPDGSALEIVRRLVAARAELPEAAVKDAHRLLGDLHLNSIVVAQLAAEAARCLDLPPPADPTGYAGATVAELARALEELAETRGDSRAGASHGPPAGVDAWVRPFRVKLVEREGPGRPRAEPGGTWRVFALPDDPLGPAIEEELERRGLGHGVVVCLPAQPDERSAMLLLDSAKALWPERSTGRFVVVQRGGGGGGFARSLHLESPQTVTCVVDVPAAHPGVAAWVADEALAGSGFREAHYDTDGRRREPVLAVLDDLPRAPLELGAEDVLLVTGGGKGIAAECALALALRHRLGLGLVGRARPQDDPELAANLERLAESGVRFRYIPADVTDPVGLGEAVRAIAAALGPVTAVLHGAGANAPRPLSALEAEDFARTVAPKLSGARNVLATLDPARLKLFVAFGSIIARTGLRGEADYAAANEWLALWVRRLQAEWPTCRCLVVEWSVWSGVGMGERLARVDALVRDGIAPIPPDVGVRALLDLIDRPVPDPAVVVAGRFGSPPTVTLEQEGLPLLRFLERPHVHYPGIELVIDAQLSVETDPYLEDHALEGEPLLPAVMGLEAMAQAASALVDGGSFLVFENVTFAHPIVVPRTGPETVRIAALVRGDGEVELVLRCAATGFQRDHFQARCHRGAASPSARPGTVGLEGEPLLDGLLPLEPDRDLYGPVLFQRGRFRCLTGYRWLRATECLAQIGAARGPEWFGRYLPSSLVLGEPGRRDAALHAIQACIPHRTLLPIAVERIECSALPAEGLLAVRARERTREADTFVYDLEIVDGRGVVLERWTGLRLRALGPARSIAEWSGPLLAPYVERRVAELVPGTGVGVAWGNGGGRGPGVEGERAIAAALGRPARVRHRPDGKPVVATEPETAVSAAHAGSMLLAVAHRGAAGCDLEIIRERPAREWNALLGEERLALADRIARETGEDPASSRTRLWVAQESLKKAGAFPDVPLQLADMSADGWVLLTAGSLRVPTFVTSIRPEAARVALAVLVGSVDACL